MRDSGESRLDEAALDTVPLVPGLLCFALISLLGNQLDLYLRYPELGAAVIFPPYAALTGFLVLSRPRTWVWYLLLAVVAHVATHWSLWPLSWVLGADLANLARALVAAALLLVLFRGAPALASIRDLIWFTAAAVVAGPAVGATIGAANVYLHGAAPGYGQPWRAWFLSNALTGLTMLPMFITGIPRVLRWRRHPVRRERIAETMLLIVALAVTCIAAFLGSEFSRWGTALPLYAPLPVLIWAALRFGVGGSSFALTVVTLAAIWAADQGRGPFLAPSPDNNVLVLQAFVLLTTLPILCMAVIAGARQQVTRLHHALLASLQDEVAILDARGRVLEVNESWRRFTDDGNGQREFGRARTGEDYLAAFTAAAEAGDGNAQRTIAGVRDVLARDSRRFEMEYEVEVEGRHQWYTLTVEALQRPDGGAVVTRANVSTRREAQIEVEAQRQELSHLARVAVVGEMSGALAHELRQPLTSILANASTALRLVRRDPLEVTEIALILEDIVSDNRRASEVIDRLRALFQRGETQRQPISIGDLVGESLELAHAELVTRRVLVTTDVEPGLPPVPVDRVQLQQVLLNLILNACDAMSARPFEERRLQVAVRRVMPNEVQVSVRDRGMGIPPELVDRLFQPFVTSKPQGLGLGLSISRTIVAAHGGRLWAENDPGGGATFHCALSTSMPTADLLLSGQEVSRDQMRTTGTTEDA
jgi:two-component system, LuxR family, sensor kinase FixL